ncbi:MAG: aldo/keto reductase [Alphaproteobacteria bacterium]|nr:aldo/keto reductase [Alphaproteobacteria bacterium]
MLYIESHGVTIPKLGLGTWQLQNEKCINAVKTALKLGYRHIDTAQIYENEECVGQAIAQSSVPRDEIFLTTKIWRDNVSAERLEKSLDASLRKLQTDYVDLLLIHWPVDEVPLDVTMETLQKMQTKAKCRLIGVSNFNTTQLHQCVDKLKMPLATNQVEYHPHLSQKPVLEFLREHNMFLTAYSPMGRSKLAGDATLQAVAVNHGKSVNQVILRWHMQQPEVVAIPKSGTEAHIKENFDIFDFSLSEEEMVAISERTDLHERLIDPDFAPIWDEPQAA